MPGFQIFLCVSFLYRKCFSLFCILRKKKTTTNWAFSGQEYKAEEILEFRIPTPSPCEALLASENKK